MKTTHIILLTSLILTLAVSGETNDQEATQEPRLKMIYSEVQRLVMRHYPEATSHLLGSKIHFESNSRVFIIHNQLKTGEWLDAQEVRGPKKGGIIGEIELRDGKWGGAAKVPQSTDCYYYDVMLKAPYSEEHDCHLYVLLYVPRLGRNNEFINDFTELVNNFETKILTANKVVESTR